MPGSRRRRSYGDQSGQLISRTGRLSLSLNVESLSEQHSANEDHPHTLPPSPPQSLPCWLCIYTCVCVCENTCVLIPSQHRVGWGRRARAGQGWCPSLAAGSRDSVVLQHRVKMEGGGGRQAAALSHREVLTPHRSYIHSGAVLWGAAGRLAAVLAKGC